jgi:hypothetical protein
VPHSEFHFRFSTDDGSRIGRHVARYIRAHAFQAVDD